MTILGEPGVGKSRLVAVFGEYLDDLDDLVTWRQGRCLPYGDGIAFWALGELVKAHAGIYDADDPEQAADKLDAVLPPGETSRWMRTRLLPLVGVDTGAGLLAGREFRRLAALLRGDRGLGPTVLVVEDIHLADQGLLEFLVYLVEWATDVPLLLICTARPELYERHATWAAGVRNATSINLGPLTPVESRELVGSLLARSELSARASTVIFESCDGNPLYAEEFVRLLAERALPDDDSGHWRLTADGGLPVPESVQGLIAARLDGLPTDEQPAAGRRRARQGRSGCARRRGRREPVRGGPAPARSRAPGDAAP